MNQYQQEVEQYIAYDKERPFNYLLPALSEEVGELQAIFAKQFRKHGNYNLYGKTNEAVSELGDILWNVAMLASALGINLGWVADMNREKLQQRKETSTIVQR